MSSQRYDEPRQPTNIITIFYDSNATTNSSEVKKVLEDVTLPRKAEELSPHHHSLTLRFVSVSTHSLQPHQVSSPTKNALIPVFGSSEEAVCTGLLTPSLNLDAQAGRMSR
jgi:hypothetical protein